MVSKHDKAYNISTDLYENNYMNIDPDLPNAPRLEIYKETFGGLENITEQWYKENRV